MKMNLCEKEYSNLPIIRFVTYPVTKLGYLSKKRKHRSILTSVSYSCKLNKTRECELC